MKARSGFTLVEILIVVVILGILAAIVIPQFTEASTEAKTSSLMTDLQTMRSQIELYKIQHNDDLPGSGGASFVEAMTQYTLLNGDLATTQAPDPNHYGPYVQQIPKNQFNDLTTITITNPTPGAAPGTGWFFNDLTGDWRAADTVAATPAHWDL
jgi:general secretion pathway protein G